MATRRCLICGDIAERMPDWLCLECSAHYRHSEPYQPEPRLAELEARCPYVLMDRFPCQRPRGHSGPHDPEPEPELTRTKYLDVMSARCSVCGAPISDHPLHDDCALIDEGRES